MKPWYIGILLFLFFQTSKQFDNDGTVNHGASTSRQDLARCRDCEISNYANEMVRLLLAEDSRRENLIDMMNNRPEELDAFHDEVFSYVNLIRVGIRGNSLPTVQNDRLETFMQHVHKAILDNIFRTCTQHYTANVWYDYEPETRTISVREHYNVTQDECLCGHFEERSYFSDYFTLPTVNRFRMVPRPNDESADDAFNTQHYIIPLELIIKFFRSWLIGNSNDDMVLTRVFENNAHRTGLCVRTLFGRLKRSMQKLVLARLRRSGELSGVTNWNNIAMMTQADYTDNFFSEIFAHARSWLGGNIFLGPASRGPHDPRFGRREGELINAFDHDSAFLLHHDHYMELLNLFFKLRFFVTNRGDTYHYWRLSEGFSLFLTMCNVFIRHPVTQTTRDQWTQQVVHRRELLRDVFWEVNKTPRRDQRSINKIKGTLANSTSIINLRHQWKDFMSVLKYVQIEASSSNETLSWDCKFSLLYSDYLFNKKHLIKDIECPECTGFDEYLYSKISLSNQWKKCNDGGRVTGDWCEAWRNVTKDSGVITNYLQHYKNKYTSSVFELDLEILVNWLYKKSGLDAVKQSEKKSNVLHDQTDLSSQILCILTTFTMNVLTGHNDCFNLLKSLKPVRLVKN